VLRPCVRQAERGQLHGATHLGGVESHRHVWLRGLQEGCQLGCPVQEPKVTAPCSVHESFRHLPAQTRAHRVLNAPQLLLQGTSTGSVIHFRVIMLHAHLQEGLPRDGTSRSYQCSIVTSAVPAASSAGGGAAALAFALLAALGADAATASFLRGAILTRTEGTTLAAHDLNIPCPPSTSS